MPDSQIAKHVRVDHEMVLAWRGTLTASGEIPQIDSRTVTRKGTTYQRNTANRKTRRHRARQAWWCTPTAGRPPAQPRRPRARRGPPGPRTCRRPVFALASGRHPINESWCMNIDYGVPYFNMTTERCRSVGRRGGRARARNLRLRPRCQADPPPAPVAHGVVETAHEASLVLDSLFPHLRGAFRQRRG